MNAIKLASKLQNFKQVCQNEGYITGELNFDEIYPSVFSVKMTGNKTWIKSLSNCNQRRCKQALDTLIGVFWQTTTIKIRKYIHLLIIENSGQKGDSRLYAIIPNLTANQIENLYYSKKFSIKLRVRKCLKTGRLNEQQICHIFKIGNQEIISFLLKRYDTDKEFKELVMSSRYSKYKYSQKII